ncbi:MAG: Atxe2 family lasso peptide isopeptidase [Sphingopyxis sp.]
MVIAAALLLAAPTAAAVERAPVSAADLVRVAEISAPTISPDGTRIAYRVSRASLDDNRIALDWYIAGIDGREIQHAGSGGTARVDGAGLIVEQAPVWDGDGKGLRYLALVDGAVAIWHWREGGRSVPDVVDPADITAFSVARDGSEIRYRVGATREEVGEAQQSAYDSGILVDQSVDINQTMAGGIIEDGRRIMLRFNGPWFDRKPILWNATVSERRKSLAPVRPYPPAAHGPASAAQERSVTRSDGAKATVGKDGVEIVFDSGAKSHCRLPVCRSGKLEAIAWRPAHDALLLFEAIGSGREKVWMWPIGAAEARTISVTDGALRAPGRPPRCAVGRDALFCADSRPLVPPRLISIDYESAAEMVLAEPNAGLARRVRGRATRMTLVGQRSAIFLEPLDRSGPVPVVVQNYHCGGFLKGGTGEELPMLPLVEHGIATLCIDPFLAPKPQGPEATYQLALDTIETALDELAAKGVIDPARVAISGFSHSSAVALWALRRSKRFKAATIGTGQMSPHHYWSNALPGRGFDNVLREHWNLGSPDDDPDRWQLLSAVWNVERIATPILMQLPDVEAAWTAELHTRLKRDGKPVEMIVFPDELHNKYQPRHKLAVYERNLDWFRFWLRGEEDASAEKSDRYRRWHALRAGRSLPAPAP